MTIGAVACRFTNDGSRMCTRAGLLEPSERTKHAELAARRLDRVVDLARRHAEALGHELEVVDERLHRGGELVARRQRDLAVLGDVRALGQAVEACSMIFTDSYISAMRTKKRS